MSSAATINEKLDALNVATNEVADEMADIRSQLKNNMTDEELAAITARIDASTARLKGLAADPENPVPPAPPEFTTARAAAAAAKK